MRNTLVEKVISADQLSSQLIVLGKPAERLKWLVKSLNSKTCQRLINKLTKEMEAVILADPDLRIQEMLKRRP